MASSIHGQYSSHDLVNLKTRLESAVRHENSIDKTRTILQGIVREFGELLNKIEQGEREWRDAFDAIKDPIFFHDTDCRILRANKAYARLAGLPIQAVIGKFYWQVFPKLDAPPPHYGQEPENGGEAFLDEITTSDGGIYSSREFALRDAQGSYRYSVHFLEDITEQRHLQHEAEESMLRYRTLFECAPDAVLLADAQTGQLLDANPAAERLTERSRAELVTMHQSELHPPGDIRARSDFIKHVTAGKAGDPRIVTEVPVLSASGRVIPVEITSFVFWLGEREVIQGIFRDISQRKLVEQALRDSEETFRAISNTAQDAVFLLDDTGNVVYWNPAAEHIFGYTSQEMIGQQAHRQLAPPRYQDDWRRAWPHLNIRGDAPATGNVQELVAQRRDSTEFPVELSVSAVRIRERWHAVGVLRDVTERKHAEAKLARFGRLLDNSINEFYVLDAETFRFLLVNEGACHNLGYSMAELSQLTPLDLSPELDPEKFETLIAPLRNDEDKVQVIETLHRRKDGSLYPVEVRLQFSAKEVPSVFVATILDISERSKANERQHRIELGLAEAQRIAHLGNWEFDLVHNHAYWSDEIYRIFEADSKELEASYETFFAMVHPDDRDRVERAYRESIKNKTPCGSTYRLLMPDGRVKYVRCMCEAYYSENDRILRSLGTLQDITEPYVTEQALNRSNHALKAISSCNSVLVHANNESELLNNMCRVIIDEGGYRFAWIGFVEDDETKSVRPVTHWGHERGYLDHINVTYADNAHGQGPAGRAVRYGEPQVVSDTLTDPHFVHWREAAAERGYRSVLALPLKNTSGEVFAVLLIYAAEANAFDTDALSLMQELASDLAFGILALRTRHERDHYLQEHQKSDERYKQVLVDTIHAISLTVEKRDPYTAGHQNKVAQLSVALGRELGMDEDRLEGLRLGAMIHDIGKIYVPAEILNRPGRLSKAEFEIIKSHSEVGYDIIKNVQFPWPVREMVLQHHERLNGSGYPSGLQGDEIILEARILAVADVVEAVTAHRPYRPGLGLDKALLEIETNRDILYDAEVVDACLHLIHDQGFIFEENVKA